MPDTTGLMAYLSQLNPALLNQGGAGMELATGGMTPQAIGTAMTSPDWNQNRFAGGPFAPGSWVPGMPAGGGAGPKAAGAMQPKFEGAEKAHGGMMKRGMTPPPTGVPAPPRGPLPMTPQMGAKTGAPMPMSTGAPAPGAVPPQQQMMMQMMQNPQFMQAIMPMIMRMFQGGAGGLSALNGAR